MIGPGPFANLGRVRTFGILASDNYGFVTLHRPSNVDDPEKLAVLVAALAEISEVLATYRRDASAYARADCGVRVVRHARKSSHSSDAAAELSGNDWSEEGRATGHHGQRRCAGGDHCSRCPVHDRSRQHRAADHHQRRYQHAGWQFTTEAHDCGACCTSFLREAWPDSRVVGRPSCRACR